jgi:hypothetical protein
MVLLGRRGGTESPQATDPRHWKLPSGRDQKKPKVNGESTVRTRHGEDGAAKWRQRRSTVEQRSQVRREETRPAGDHLSGKPRGTWVEADWKNPSCFGRGVALERGSRCASPSLLETARGEEQGRAEGIELL